MKDLEWNEESTPFPYASHGAAPAVKGAGRRGKTPRAITVLLIEDNRGDAELIQEYLNDVEGLTFHLERAERLLEGLGRLARGGVDVVLLDLSLPDARGLDSFNKLTAAAPEVPVVVLTGFDDEVLALKAVQHGAEDYLVKGFVNSNLLARALRYAIERNRRRRAEEELREAREQFRAAREIQQRLFPAAAPSLPGFDVAGASFPAEATGGDYFDYVPMTGGGTGVVVSDVSGHGLGPALVMASTRAYLRALAQTHAGVGDVMTLTNRVLCDDVGEDRFVTLLLARLDPVKRSLLCANAGHPSGFVLDRLGRPRHELASTGLPLGVDRGAEHPAGEPVSLAPGEIVLLLTDGVVEARSPDNTAFGTARAFELVRYYRNDPAARIVENLYYAVRAFAQNEPQLDDVTAVVIKVGDEGG